MRSYFLIARFAEAHHDMSPDQVAPGCRASAYLDLRRGSNLFLHPWHIWAVDVAPNATIHEITTATEWVDFVRSYPLRHNGLTYPDWAAVSRDHDAVHMTLRAAIAVQGLQFAVGQTTTAAPYWDIESTLWLHWRFPYAELLEAASFEVGRTL